MSYKSKKKNQTNNKEKQKNEKLQKKKSTGGKESREELKVWKCHNTGICMCLCFHVGWGILYHPLQVAVSVWAMSYYPLSEMNLAKLFSKKLKLGATHNSEKKEGSWTINHCLSNRQPRCVVCLLCCVLLFKSRVLFSAPNGCQKKKYSILTRSDN